MYQSAVTPMKIASDNFMNVNAKLALALFHIRYYFNIHVQIKRFCSAWSIVAQSQNLTDVSWSSPLTPYGFHGWRVHGDILWK